jgi:hypothetical protein
VSHDDRVVDYRLDHRVDARGLRRLSWKDLGSALEKTPASFAGALVLVGGEYAGSGDEAHRVPAFGGRPSVVSGLVVQGLAVDTILHGFPIRAACGRMTSAGLVLTGAMIFGAILLAVRPALAIAGALAAMIAYSVVAALTFVLSGVLLPVAVPLVLVVAGSMASFALRSRLVPVPSTASSAAAANARRAVRPPQRPEAELPELEVPELETTERQGDGTL